MLSVNSVKTLILCDIYTMESLDKLATQKERRPPFQEQLLAAWKKLHPEGFDIVVEEQERLRKSVTERERVINDTEVITLLKEYGIALENLELCKTPEGRFELKIKDHFHEERLPPGYAYKGGAARALLLRNLRIDPKARPRDIDIVRLVEKESSSGTDDELAQRFMSDDYATGHGVEHVDDVAQYFATRDFTFNELLATDSDITMTRGALLDTLRHIVRLSDYEATFDESDEKLFAKAIRLYAESIYRYGYAEFSWDGWKFEHYGVSLFWMMLHLDRAYERGTHVADQFVLELAEKNLIPSEVQTAEQARELFAASIRNPQQFYYRYAPSKQFQIEEELADRYGIE